MKNILFGALLLTIPVLVVSAQSFEGKITYQNAYKSKMPSVNDEQFKMMLGDKQEFYAKGANYKSVMNGQMMKWQIYLAKDNKLYNKMAMQDVIYYNDGSMYNDSIISTVINKDVTQIAGYKCDELILTTKQGTQKFYFNPVTKIDAGLFKNHKFGNWGEVIARINAIPLKMVIETPQFSLESTAVEVTPMKLDDSLFKLPDGAVIQKSPF